MIRKLPAIWIVLMLVLSGCAGTGATESPVATAAGFNPANCTNSAEFVSDITVPDGTTFDAGETFNKIWRVKNTGNCPWAEQYTLVFVGGEQMGAPNSTPLTVTQPGEMIDIGVKMTAPDIDDIYQANFEIHDPAGEAIPIDKGTILWVIINVGTGTNDTGGGPGFASVSCAFTTSQTNVDAVVDAINVYRADNDLPALTVNPELTAAAQAHSDDMACNNLFVHDGSNGSTPESRASAAGYSGNVTENVYGRNPVPTGQEAVTWWATDQSDPSHSRNLITTQYTEIGVGYSFFDGYGYYAVVFGAP